MDSVDRGFRDCHGIVQAGGRRIRAGCVFSIFGNVRDILADRRRQLVDIYFTENF